MEPRTMLYNLEGALNYSKNGDFEETLQLELDPPAFNTMKEATKLAQAFTRALMSQRDAMQRHAADNQQVGAAKDLGAAEIKLIMFGADIDFSDIIDGFVTLCTKACTLDQERKVKMRKEHFEKLSYNDAVNLICEYISTFTVPSVLSGLEAGGNS